MVLPKIVKQLVKLEEAGINILLEKWDQEELTEKLIEVIKNEKCN